MRTQRFESFSAEETAKIASCFGEKAKAGDIFCLSGMLGAGKTVFAQGFVRGIGYEGHVTSPTFTIMNEYENGRLPVYHFDLYRLEGGNDLENIGYEEYFFSGGVSLVEWPERAQDVFPKNVYFVKINSNLSRGDAFREICIENFGD
ncbi:MAG: tRNA (adenosine(37)-N6)-threonylcarbamoyltransferase complex ATPase subunit type 1 TsaE [Defluviitaleaceae bacterium]|nr:tRNA (adenosine(37)-N6)-threonylcarbamoyltransferase complex ATPase subunit type 1 TsaE [Defluviitaleaceae bacterium]